MPESSTPWGWSGPDRALLAACILAVAVALRIAGGPDRDSGGGPPSGVAVPINEAPPRLLLALPGLGPTRVDRVVSARGERPFDSFDDLAERVKGVGPTTVEGIRPFATLAPVEPPEPNPR